MALKAEWVWYKAHLEKHEVLIELCEKPVVHQEFLSVIFLMHKIIQLFLLFQIYISFLWGKMETYDER